MPDYCCQCGCYPNGLVVLIVVQILLVLGFSLSAYSVLDCHFVVVDETVVEPLNSIFNKTALAGNSDRGLGFVFFEDVDGKCNYDNDHTEDTFETYMDFLGDDWDGSQGAAASAVVFSFIALVWLAIFSCVSHNKIVRWVLAGFMLLIGILQASTFSILDSDFCDENECEIGRSARTSAAATPMFFLAALLMLFTRDYPGGTATVQPATPKVARVVDEVTHGTQPAQGLSTVQEVPVENEFVDVALGDANATSHKTPASVY